MTKGDNLRRIIMRTIYVVPSIYEKQNVWMYCNYARMNNTLNICKDCLKDCPHKGKETVIEV